MILSTSVTNRSIMKTSFVYLLISIFVALFGAIYEMFSYGVYSNFMLYAFAFPLVGGCLPFFLLGFWGYSGSHAQRFWCKTPSTIARNLYHSGIATLTIGNVIRGVLDIYGTTNYMTNYYWVVGIALLLLGVLGHFSGIWAYVEKLTSNTQNEEEIS